MHVCVSHAHTCRGDGGVSLRALASAGGAAKNKKKRLWPIQPGPAWLLLALPLAFVHLLPAPTASTSPAMRLATWHAARGRSNPVNKGHTPSPEFFSGGAGGQRGPCLPRLHPVPTFSGLDDLVDTSGTADAWGGAGCRVNFGRQWDTSACRFRVAFSRRPPASFLTCPSTTGVAASREDTVRAVLTARESEADIVGRRVRTRPG